MARQFKGEIRLDIRQSKGDWDAVLETNAPEGAPNVLVIIYDDIGCAAWSPYGGRINMPTMDHVGHCPRATKERRCVILSQRKSGARAST